MAGRKRKATRKQETNEEESKKRREIPVFDPERPIEQYIGAINPRLPHPGDIDQPADHDFKMEDLGEKREGENFDSFEVEEEVRRRGGAACNSVMLMKHKNPLPMWFDEFLCPRVMPGKRCGYVGYAFRRRIRFGSWPNWQHVPQDVKDGAWEDILASWDIRTKLTDEEHKLLKKQWTTYASNKMRNWRTKVADRYIWDTKRKIVGKPWEQYRWMDKKEWELFECYRRSEKFAKLRAKGKASAKQKKYRHHTGSGGYRVIYIAKAKEMREEAIQERIAQGMTRQEAEVEVSKLYFRVDRSIVFLEANKDKTTKEYSEEFVRELEAKILEMNQEKKEGKLKLDGREDILVIATGKADHPGRYRGCSTTAKQAEALPHYKKGKSQNKNQTKAPTKEGEHGEVQGPTVDFATLDNFAGWICEQLGVERPADMEPSQFFQPSNTNADASSSHPSKINMPTAPGAPDGGDNEDQGGVPCYLQVRDRDGEIITAAGGLVFPKWPVSLQAIPFTECVKICNPIFKPNAPVHFYSRDHPTVGTSVGIPINWPEEFIDYKMKQPVVEDKKLPQESSEDSESTRSNDVDADSTPHTEEQEFGDVDAKFCTLTVDPLREFEHHVRDPAARSEFLEFFKEMKAHPQGREVYYLGVDAGVFGPRSLKLVLSIPCSLRWINKAKAPRRKEWIEHNQMDMWACFVHSRIPPEDRGRVHFINTNSSFMNFNTLELSKQNVVTNVLEIFNLHQARLYIMPICKNQHWTMVFIIPEQSAVFCIDSSQLIIVPSRRPYELDVLISIGAAYDAEIRKQLTTWTITNITHKVQPNGWECDYYCMLYMEKMALLTKDIDVHKAFPEEHDAYPLPIIEGLIDTFCRTMNGRIAPMCRDINDRPRRASKAASESVQDREIMQVV